MPPELNGGIETNLVAAVGALTGVRFLRAVFFRSSRVISPRVREHLLLQQHRGLAFVEPAGPLIGDALDVRGDPAASTLSPGS